MVIQKDAALAIYKTMLTIRRFEEEASRLLADNKLPGFLHLSIGHEAVAATAGYLLKKDDYITSTHRGHGHCIAKGGDINRMMAELYGKQTGYSRGTSGSMHIADMELGILGANGIVGAGIPIATGAGYSIQARGTDQVAVCFFGDGAVNEGAFHESLNIASLWKLPVIYVCENNQYAEMTPQSVHFAGESISARARSYGMKSEIVDGSDVEALYAAISCAVDDARRNQGPVLLEVMVERFRGHFEGDNQSYRSAGELEAMKERDPLTRFQSRLLAWQYADDPWLAEQLERTNQSLMEAISFAEHSADATVSDMLTTVYA